MKTSLLFAAVAGITLVSAAPPADPIPWEDEESLSSYPPCSRTVTDRCIQTNERGGASRQDMVRNDEPPRSMPAQEPESYAASDYPPCSADVTDRCIQTRDRGVRTARAAPKRQYQQARSAPKRQHHEARTQLAMRAGERG
jgi:hypothetical protein